jgi:hypothetical protein
MEDSFYLITYLFVKKIGLQPGKDLFNQIRNISAKQIK